MRQTPEHINWNALRELRDLFLDPNPLPSPYWVSRQQLDDYDRTLGERIGWKWDAVLHELRLRNWSPPSRTLTDFGCGTGIAARRLLAHWPDTFDHVVLIDHSRIAAAFARERIQRDFPRMPVRLATPDAPLEGVTLLSHILNELPENLKGALPERLSAAQALLWVEPGTPDAGRRIVDMRETLRESFTLVAPCPHQGRCGLLTPENAPHWCHHFAPAPPHTHQDPFWGHFRREMNLEISPVAYSFLVADRHHSPDSGLSHLLGNPLRLPKFMRLLSCQDPDVSELVVSRKAGNVYRDLKRPASPSVYRFQRRKNRIVDGEWIGKTPPKGDKPMPGTNPLIGGGGFHHVALRVLNFDRSLRFYQDLGFSPARHWGEPPKRAAMLDSGDGNFIEIFEGGLPDTPSEGRIIHFALRTTDCDAAQALALAAGAEETMPPKDVTIPSHPTPYPVRISFVKSPSGELIEFFQER